MAGEPWTAEWLEERCAEYRDSLLRRRTATPEEIAEYWPGGRINTEDHEHGKWIFCYANLIGMLRSREPKLAHARADEAMAAQLAREPVAVKFDDGETRLVHPKSYHALRWLDSLNRSLNDLVAAVAEHGDDAEFLKALTLSPLIESAAVRTWLWILTEGDAQGNAAALPFDEGTELVPPEWTRHATMRDILAVFRAHLKVNADDLRTIAEAFPAESSGESRLSLAGFLGTAAHELGVQPSDILHRWSLGEVFAQSMAVGQASREARERAKAGAS